MTSSGYVDFQISSSIITDEVMRAGRYQKFCSMYRSKMFLDDESRCGLAEPFMVMSQPLLQHLSEQQSRAMKSALLESVEVLDSGFMVE